MTIEEAVAEFRSRLPRASEEQARQFADEEFSESSDVARFIQIWRNTQDFSAKVEQSQFASDVARIWPEGKGH